jgi:hypothetical protein
VSELLEGEPGPDGGAGVGGEVCNTFSILGRARGGNPLAKLSSSINPGQGSSGVLLGKMQDKPSNLNFGKYVP